MFTPIHLLPQNTGGHRKYKERWETVEGRALHDKILEMIRQGGGEDFLEADFQSGRLGFLEDERDLQGFQLHNENIVFPKEDNFQAIDFSYAEFWNSHFTNAFFYCTMSFTKFYGCTFTKCIFSFNHCYAAMFDKVTFIDCDFIEYDTFTNCSFSETVFKNTFFPTNGFHDCLFDAKTKFDSFPERPSTAYSESVRLQDENKSDLFRAVSEAYLGGRVRAMARTYKFRSLQCSTRHNTEGFREKIAGFVFEYLSGYGLRPSRVIAAMFTYFLLAFLLFASQVGFQDSLLLTCGALFTFGAKAQLLDKMSWLFHFVYILSSFAGISLTALFVTVLVNVFVTNN
ncbi:MAG: hypothetical protein WBW16_02825 [Bacteroidota bacterium]